MEKGIIGVRKRKEKGKYKGVETTSIEQESI
jgi:hypothetical protein